MKTSFLLVGVITLSFILIFGFLASPSILFDQEDIKQTNILLITLEATRADRLSCYGYERNTTNNICNLKEDGVLFKNVYSNSANTATSLPVIFTSKHPYRFYTHAHFHPLPEENVLFKELKNAGYEINFYSDFLTKKLAWIDFDINRFDDPIKMNKDIVNEISENGSPSFTWVHYDHNHFPYVPGDEFKGTYSDLENVNKTVLDKVCLTQNCINTDWSFAELKEEYNVSREIQYIKNLYDDYIKESDYIISNLINGLKEKEVYNDTLIILTSDHGESLGEHGVYFDHRKLYNQNLHVPFIMKLPGNAPNNKIVESQFSLVNLHKTLMDFIGMDPYKNEDLDGRSILPLLEENNFSEHIVSRWANQFSLQTDVYKYIYDTKTGEEELYNISEDKNETHNLIGAIETPKKFVDFRKKIDEKKDFWEHPRNFKESISDELKEDLKKLGYIE